MTRRTRLCSQLVVVTQAAAAGRERITSGDLARHASGAPSRIRHDLRRLGMPGKRGVGYDVAGLLARLETRLGARPRGVAIVGAAGLGRTLAESPLLGAAGVEIRCIFDPQAERLGTVVAGCRVRSLESLARVVRGSDVDAGVIATDATVAPRAHAELAGAGVSLIVNFADVLLPCADVPVHHPLAPPALLLAYTSARS